MSSSVSLDVVANPPVRCHAIEAGFGAISGQLGMFRRSSILAALCFAFGGGAAAGAFATKGIPVLALGIPVVVLLIVLLRCERARSARRMTRRFT